MPRRGYRFVEKRIQSFCAVGAIHTSGVALPGVASNEAKNTLMQWCYKAVAPPEHRRTCGKCVRLVVRQSLQGISVKNTHHIYHAQGHPKLIGRRVQRMPRRGYRFVELMGKKYMRRRCYP
jgi:hypothetical protein